MTPGRKRIVTADVNFGELCTVSRSADVITTMAKKGVSPCAISKATDALASYEYSLLVSWVALDWFDLMNLFQFTVDVYLAFFLLVGLLSIVQAVRSVCFASRWVNYSPCVRIFFCRSRSSSSCGSSTASSRA
jgi:hypothetical protein